MTGHARLIAYVTSTALAALVAIVSALPRVDPVPGLVLMLAVFTAERFASVLRDRVAVSVSSIVLLVAVLYGGAALAVVSALGAVPAFALRRAPFRLMRLMFNSGQFVVSAAAAGLAYETAAFLLDGSFPDWRSLLAITIAAAVYCVVNHALVAGVVALTSPDTFLDTFRTIGPSLVMQVPYVGIAVLTVVVVERASWWALLLMGVPAIIARYGLLAFQELDEDYERMVRSFVKAIEIKDLYTRGHSERVSELSVRVAEELGVGYEERRITKYAALLHDVGKIGVPLCIINKPGPLDDDEFAKMQEHPTIGVDILHDIGFLEPEIDIVRYHHERLDGCGYPHGVDAAQLSPLVRIVTAVDAFDAMTSTRSYRRALDVEAAIAELERCSGAQFDGEVVAALAAYVRRVGWEPTSEFASEHELNGAAIPDAPVGELRRSRGAMAGAEAPGSAAAAQARRPSGP
ncbi:MAG: HD-GYP domain-containing protein [Nitriliruptoraceae bacterium]